jgi:hypothetical protein
MSAPKNRRMADTVRTGKLWNRILAKEPLPCTHNMAIIKRRRACTGVFSIGTLIIRTIGLIFT